VSNTGFITASDLSAVMGDDYEPAEVKAMMEVRPTHTPACLKLHLCIHLARFLNGVASLAGPSTHPVRDAPRARCGGFVLVPWPRRR
jgi:hypothetical protein